MASSPYRFTIQNDTPQEAPRSRVGLSSITSGGGSAGGEGYRASALRPGSSGWMAATFGGAPRTDYVRPTTTATVTATPTATQTAAPTLVPEYAGGSPGAEGGSGQTGGPEGFDAGGAPGDMGDLSGVLGDISPGRAAMAGAGIGSMFGIPGAIAGGLLGYGVGSFMGSTPAAPQPTAQVTAQPTAPGVPGAGDGGMADGLGPTGNEQMGHDANAAAGNENASAQASADTADAEAAAGDPGAKYAAGGPVNRLMKDMPMDNKPKGLSQVQNFGGFADGGSVGGNPNATDFDAARVAATSQWGSLPVGYRDPSAGLNMRRDPVLNRNNMHAAIMANSAERWPGAQWTSPDPIQALIQSRPDLRQAIIDQIGSVHPVNPATPSTGYMGAYAGGGHVPNYAEGGPVDGAGLAGPNPPGPDDGYAALDGGEYVVQAQQAQRPDYASVLEQINQGIYNPAGEGMGEEGMGDATTEGVMPAEGGAGTDPSSLPPMMQQALGQAVAADPMLAQALTSLLGPEAVNELMACCGGGMGMGEDMAGQGEHETPFGRPPLAGPKPPPGINSPPGVRPPAAASPMMPMPPPMGGLRGIAA